MLRWERLAIPLDEWDRVLDEFPDRTLFQSASWLRFLAETVRGELVLAALRDGNAECGYFAGMIVSKFGLRILGSPFPGWTTSYMGVMLRSGVSRMDAIAALRQFAFHNLNCVHMEVMDQRIETRSANSDYRVRNYKGYEIDLSLSQDRLFANLFPACRRCVRKASRSGIRIQEAHDAAFASDYYRQLEEVFARQGLRPTYALERVQALIRNLLPTNNLLLLRALDSAGQCIATGIFPAMNDRAYFWGGASWREHQHLRPNEAVMWHAVRYWKNRGMRYFDFSGAGDYKRKYGAYEISVPWLRVSRYPLLPMLRDGAMLMNKIRQRWQGAWQMIDSPQYNLHRTAAPAKVVDA
jgi:CelD/BcsL family acetyltransferase involved in cellulose biosynthesis